jgi:hypothetical protein
MLYLINQKESLLADEDVIPPALLVLWFQTDDNDTIFFCLGPIAKTCGIIAAFTVFLFCSKPIIFFQK